MWRECRHIKATGSKCDAPALKGMPYCYFHRRLHQAIHRQKPSSAAFFDLPPLEDRASVQIALSHVVRALANGSMDPQRAGRMIYALQVNLQFAHNNSSYADSDSVESLTHGKDGDDLAPEEFNCSKSDDCQTCPYYDECDHEVIGAKNDDGDDDEEDDEHETGDTEDEAAGNDGGEAGDGDQDSDSEADAAADGEDETAGAEDVTDDKGDKEDADADRDSGKPVAEESSSEDSGAGRSDEEYGGFTVEAIKNHKDYIAAAKYLDSIRRQAGIDP
jgi:hypothetical protein